MLCIEPTPEMLAEWRVIHQKYRDRLTPNRRSGTELIAYLLARYPLTEFKDAYAASIVSDNITENPHSAAKLPAGTPPRPRTFWLENQGTGARFFTDDPIYRDQTRIFVGIDEVTGEFHIEMSHLLWDELFAFRGLDEEDLQNCYLVAEYLACREKQLTFRTASLADLDTLVRTRIEVLRAANSLPEAADLSAVEEASRRYYEKAFTDGSHTALLVFDGEEFVGAGGVSYYQVMPTVHNPTGQKAYIMNMYTAPDHRRRGIAKKVLAMLVDDAHGRGITHITLEATAMGRPLYEAFGFVPMADEMILPETL